MADQRLRQALAIVVVLLAARCGGGRPEGSCTTRSDCAAGEECVGGRCTRTDIRIGMRYFFQPRMCMLQWRHSGLVNYIHRVDGGLRIRLEGLWIG